MLNRAGSAAQHFGANGAKSKSTRGDQEMMTSRVVRLHEGSRLEMGFANNFTVLSFVDTSFGGLLGSRSMKNMSMVEMAFLGPKAINNNHQQ